jgi:TPR repeat protein
MVGRRAISPILTAFSFVIYSAALPELESSAQARAAAQEPVPPYPLTHKDAVQLRCDELAEAPDDPMKSGPGVPLDQINTSEALPVCEQAATRQAWRARYQFLFGRVLEAEGQLAEASKWYAAAGRGGFPEAYVSVGSLFSRTQPPQYATAASWYQEAVRHGSAKGALMLGWLYQTGNGLQKNPAEAVRLYTDAGNRGLADAMYRLGLMYKNGDGVQRDPGMAAQCFYEAGRRHHPYAQEELGWMAFTGSGVKRDDLTALGWFLPAAQAGLVRSQTAVATIYDEGQVVAKDPAKAVEWYRRAAAQNGTFAIYQLGLHYRAGNGVAWSEAEAMRLLKKAGDQGSAEAEYFVGMGYEYGLGQSAGQGIQDYGQAISWLNRSADHGNGYALIELALLSENGFAGYKDLQQAKRLYLKASNSSNPDVANYARKCLADLTDTSSESPARGQEKSSGILPLIAIGGGLIALAILFGGPSEHGGGGGAPSVGGYPTGTGVDLPTSTPEPRTPTCHQVPVESSGTISGSCSVTPTSCGLSGATRLECN